MACKRSFLADEDLLHWIIFNSAVFRFPYEVPPGGRRTLRRHRAQCQTALRRLQETLGNVILHRHTKTTKAEASNGLGFRFVSTFTVLYRFLVILPANSVVVSSSVPAKTSCLWCLLVPLTYIIIFVAEVVILSGVNAIS